MPSSDIVSETSKAKQDSSMISSMKTLNVIRCHESQNICHLLSPALKATCGDSALGINKCLFNDYSLAMPTIAQAVDLSIRVAAAAKLALDMGDDGYSLPEFGQYCDIS